MQPSDYLASLELGAELKGGSGTAWIIDFSVELTIAALRLSKAPMLQAGVGE